MNILKIIGFIILIVLGLGLFIYKGINNDEEKFKYKNSCLLGVVPILIAFAMMSVAIVPANTVGVKYSMIGGTSKKTLNEGVHIIVPFVDKVYEIDTTVQERTDKDVSVQTKDAQWVKMEVNVKYQVSKENAFKVYKGYKTLDNLNKNIIGNYAQDAFNSVCSEYNVIDILGEKRNEILNKTTEVLNGKFKSEGVTLKALTIKDIDAGEAIEKAISDEAVAKKEVETAKQKQEKAKTEAETKLIEAQGEADANKVKTKQLTDQILLEQWIEKWNGELPKVAGENGVMIDINELLKEASK